MSRVARAQSIEQASTVEARQGARQHFEQGVALANNHLYTQALEEFQQAYQLSPHYAVQYNIGQAYIALEQPVEAIKALERYLAEGGSEIAPNRMHEVRAQIDAERTLTAEVALSVNVSNAVIVIDGHEVGRSPLLRPVRIAAGNHTITARGADGTQLSRPVTLQRRDRLVVNFELPPGVSPVLLPIVADAPKRRGTSRPPRIEPSPTSRGVPTVSESKHGVSTLGYALGIVGLAVGAVAFGDYMWNRGRYERWTSTHRELQGTSQPGDYSQRQKANNDLASSIQRASYVTVGLGVAAGVLTVTGITVVVFEQRDRELGDPKREHSAVLTLRGLW